MNFNLNFVKIISQIIALIFARIFYPFFLFFNFSYVKRVYEWIYSYWILFGFAAYGRNTIIYRLQAYTGGKYIRIGNNCSIGRNTTLTAWDRHNNSVFNPSIIIGDNVSIGAGAHISCINNIEIGDNVLIGKLVTLVDNSHGKINEEEINSPPHERQLFSSGPIIIENSVWIGDKVSILSGVTIGKNSIVGANSVVTKNVPKNCVVAGTPAKVIRTLK
jgi:acetyltransferase-like isoleucine patch superfamily enzyme